MSDALFIRACSDLEEADAEGRDVATLRWAVARMLRRYAETDAIDTSAVTFTEHASSDDDDAHFDVELHGAPVGWLSFSTHRRYPGEPFAWTYVPNAALRRRGEPTHSGTTVLRSHHRMAGWRQLAALLSEGSLRTAQRRCADDVVARALETAAESRGEASVVAELRQLLGARLVAYIGEAGQTMAVRAWAEGTAELDPVITERFYVALTAARIVAAAHGTAMTQTWFQGRQPELGDRSPARALRELPDVEAAEKILAIARSFSVE